VFGFICYVSIHLEISATMVRSLPEELPKHHRKVTIANTTEPTCSHHNRYRSSDAIDETGCFRVTEQETGLRNIRHRFNSLRLALRWTRRAVGMSLMTVALLFCESAYGLLPLWQLSALLLENTQDDHGTTE
jgi:hypothetical protein